MLFSGKCWLKLFKVAGQSHVLESHGQFAWCPAIDGTPGKFTYYLTLGTYLENVSQFGLYI